VVALLAALLLALPHTVPAADMGKTLRVEFPIAETTLDPQAAYDSYSFYVIAAIFDPLYRYDYFARPVRMVPNTAEGLPQITDGGRTFTVKVRPGIHFAADPAFNGKPRELTAADYVYSIKRILDPKVRSYYLYLFEGNLVGLDPVLAAARKTGVFDYDTPLPGVMALDRYTLRVRFVNPDYGFAYWLTTNPLAAVAREVVEKYQDDAHRVGDHPVGTGPYRLAARTRGQKIRLEANPDFRVEVFPVPGPGSDPGDAAIAKANAGKRLPIVGNVEISVIEEAQPRLLTFEQGGIDLLHLPSALAENVLDGEKLKPAFAQRGVRLHRLVQPTLTMNFFNMDDPVVGGYTNERIALRRAIGMGFDNGLALKMLHNGQAVPATQIIPPPIPGHDPAQSSAMTYDPAAARALLDRFGYKDRDGDGYRETPDGKPLTVLRGSTPDAQSRAYDELWKRGMDAIGIRMTVITQKWPELNKMTEAGQLPMWGLSWTTGIPDADSFFTPLYSKTIGTQNDARLRSADLDRLYEASRRLPPGPARNALYAQMTTIVRNLAPWLLRFYPYENVLAQPWLLGFKQNPFVTHQWMYYDVAPH
jgi:ABC-type transport system substrate-binding protein